MRVLVTGGLGFIGYAVSCILSAGGHHVTVLARSLADPPPFPEGIRLVRADLREHHQVERGLAGCEFDSVCHLAGLARVRDSFDNPLEYFRTSLGGTINLLSALAQQSTRPAVVLASTGAVYGHLASGAIDEDAPTWPDTPYAASKRAAEQLLTFQARTGAIGACVLRLFSVSGTYNGRGDGDDTRIITKALLVAAGQAPAVTINGDGSARREFTHVRDAAQAFRLAAEVTEPGDEHVYNVGTGQGVSVSRPSAETDRDGVSMTSVGPLTPTRVEVSGLGVWSLRSQSPYRLAWMRTRWPRRAGPRETSSSPDWTPSPWPTYSPGTAARRSIV